jgi:hypothetical protein
VKFYILKNKIPVETDIKTWSRWTETEQNRPLAKDVREKVTVSTIFLGYDMPFHPGPFRLFETMIFGGKYDQYQWGYTTYEEAEKGHKEVLMLVEREYLDNLAKKYLKKASRKKQSS